MLCPNLDPFYEDHWGQLVIFTCVRIVSTMKKLNISHKLLLKPVTIDDIASVRYIHSSAFNAFASSKHSEEEADAQINMINSSEFVDLIMSNNLYCAWLGDEMVGTSGWCPADDNGGTARITMLAVRPMFSEIGIGSFLVNTAEKRAKYAGFYDYSVRSNINSVSFFKTVGYKISSYGVLQTPMKIDLPVAFMRKRNISKQTYIQRDLAEPLYQQSA